MNIVWDNENNKYNILNKYIILNMPFPSLLVMYVIITLICYPSNKHEIELNYMIFVAYIQI